MALYWFKYVGKRSTLLFIGTNKTQIENARQQKIDAGVEVSRMFQNLGSSTILYAKDKIHGRAF